MTNSRPDYRLGIALSGGGARGFAHAGALKALEEGGLRPDIIAGVSSGSVVATLYAAGYSPDAILKIFLEAKITDFVEINFSRGSVLKIDRFAQFLSRAFGKVKTFADLRIPAYVGVTNLSDGRHEEIHEGDLLTAVKASCSIPITFPPVRIGGRQYVDGGVVRNLPAWTIRDKCSLLIGINVSPLPDMNTDNPSLLDVAMRTYELMAKYNQTADMKMCDIAIQMREISQHGVFSLNEIEKVFNSGYFHMRKALRDAGLWNSTDE